MLGVTSWLPTWRDGRIIGWTLDFMRHRTDSPNGIMEFLIARMAERLRDEGLEHPECAVEFMSLSAAPLAGMNPQRDNADETGHMDTGTVMLQHALQIVADWMEPAYGFHSLFNFKRKFQPTEEPVYICYPDPTVLAQIGLAVVRAYVPSLTAKEAMACCAHCSGSRPSGPSWVPDNRRDAPVCTAGLPRIKTTIAGFHHPNRPPRQPCDAFWRVSHKTHVR